MLLGGLASPPLDFDAAVDVLTALHTRAPLHRHERELAPPLGGPAVGATAPLRRIAAVG